MPLHLLGKKSWNVYNAANIARVKSDEVAEAARIASEEERMRQFEAERRSALLRGQTPPPLPEPVCRSDERGNRAVKNSDGRDRKRRRLVGEDDTDRDIRLAKTTTGPGNDENAAVLKLRRPTSDAPLADHAGNINLFPVDLKEVSRRERNAEVEREKRKKDEELQDRHSMRLSSAAGRGVAEKPWYTGKGAEAYKDKNASTATRPSFRGLENKDVFGNDDPRRTEREHARIAANDPLVLMNRGWAETEKYLENKKRLAEARDRELQQLRATEERDQRRDRIGKRKKRDEEDELEGKSSKPRHHRRRHARSQSRSESRERKHDHKDSHHRSSGHGHSHHRERVNGYHHKEHHSHVSSHGHYTENRRHSSDHGHSREQEYDHHREYRRHGSSHGYHTEHHRYSSDYDHHAEKRRHSSDHGHGHSKERKRGHDTEHRHHSSGYGHHTESRRHSSDHGHGYNQEQDHGY